MIRRIASLALVTLAAALIDLANDPDRRKQCGVAGRARVEAMFDLQRMVADYRRVCLG